MPRRRKLPPGAGISKEISGTGKTFFRARLSKVFLGEGSKKKAFPTEGEAFAWVFDEQAKLAEAKKSEAVGDAWELSLDALSEVKVALAKLNGRASLLDAAEAWLKFYGSTEETKTVQEAIEVLRLEMDAERLGTRHRREVKAKLLLYWGSWIQRVEKVVDGKKVIEELEMKGYLSKNVNELTRTDVDAMLAKPAGKNAEKGPPSLSLREKRKRYSRILINFCIDRRWIHQDRNPLGIVRRKKKHATDREAAEIYIFSPLEVAQLLWSAQQNVPEALGGLVLKLFSGMRNPEMESVRWRVIQDGSIFLKAAFTKNLRTRPVTTEPVLVAWLDILSKDKDPRDLVFTYLPKRKDREAAWQIALRKIADGAGWEQWPQNGMRHCFCSYHVALYKDTARTAEEAGNSEAVIKAKYLNAVRQSDCKQFWRLYPAVVEALVQMPAEKVYEPEQEDEPEPDPKED